MKNTKLFKFISTPILASGVILPIATLSSCKIENDGDKPTPVSDFVNFNYSLKATEDDVMSFNSPTTLHNTSSYPFKLQIRTPKEGPETYLKHFCIQIRYGYSDQEWTPWQSQLFEEWTGESIEYQLGAGAYVQIRMGFDDVTLAGSLNTGKYDPIQIEIDPLSETQLIEPGQGVTLGGNAMSLLCYIDTYETKERWRGCKTLQTSYCFEELFSGSEMITDVKPQFLPYTRLTEGCYKNMFSNCSHLTVAPALPGIVLADYCYESMFNGCYRLLTAPYLPARALANGCYNAMFYACNSLNYVGLAYVGSFIKDYFENWLGENENSGIICYSGEDTTRGLNAIPTNFNIQKDSTIIAKTTPITVLADPNSSIVSGVNKIRFYNDQLFNSDSVQKQLKAIQTYKKQGETWLDWWYKSGSIFKQLEYDKGTTIADLSNTTIYPRYGFHPVAVENACNLITHEAVTLHITKASGASIYYKNITAGEEKWTEITGTEQALSADQQYLFRGYTKSTSTSNYTNIKITGTAGSVDLEGSVMGLISGATGTGTETNVSDFSFYKLFAGSTAIKSVNENFLYYADSSNKYHAITDLTNKKVVYGSMFENCTSLTNAPDLPAVQAGNGTYYSMFKGCTSLATVGAIPATSCGRYHPDDSSPYFGTFESMFEGCSALKCIETDTKASERKGLQIADGQIGMYHKMFYNSGLTDAPEIALTSLPDGIQDLADKGEAGATSHYGVCSSMFHHCTKLINGPTSICNGASAVAAGQSSLRNMFADCINLKYTPKWNFSSLGKCAMEYMFNGCSSLLECKSGFTNCNSWGNYCLAGTFMDCSSLKVLPAFGDRQIGNSEAMFKWTFKNCNSVQFWCYRDNALPSDYKHFFTFSRQVLDTQLSKCAKYALGMLNNQYHGGESNTWNHSTTKKESGTPDFTGASWYGAWKYGYKAR